jgi:hypothetical protein
MRLRPVLRSALLGLTVPPSLRVGVGSDSAGAYNEHSWRVVQPENGRDSGSAAGSLGLFDLGRESFRCHGRIADSDCDTFDLISTSYLPLRDRG